MSEISRSTSPSEASIFSSSSDLDRPSEYRIHVAYLPPGFPDYRLRELFEPFGPVIDIWVASASTFGFVVYRNKEDAQTAIDEMDGRGLESYRLKVTWARPRTRNRYQRDDPEMRCYKCGHHGHYSRECGTRMMPEHFGHCREYRDPYVKSYRRSRSRSPCSSSYSMSSTHSHCHHNVPMRPPVSYCRGSCCAPMDPYDDYEEPCRGCEMRMTHKSNYSRCHHR